MIVNGAPRLESRKADLQQGMTPLEERRETDPTTRSTILFVATMEAREKPDKMPIITFIDKDAKGIVPHQGDLVVFSLTIAGYQMSQLLVKSGSSANVIFPTCFEALGVQNQL